MDWQTRELLNKDKHINYLEEQLSFQKLQLCKKDWELNAYKINA